MVETYRHIPVNVGDSLLANMMHPLRRVGESIANLFHPSAEASRSGESVEIALELPGISDDDVEITLHDDVLTISGEKRSEHEEKTKTFYFSERSYGRFERSFRLPADLDPERIDATFERGVLTVKIPRRAATQSEAKKIHIRKG